MQISNEGKVAIFLALFGLAGAGAVIVNPELKIMGWIMIGVAVIGSLLLAMRHLSDLWSKRHDNLGRRKMLTFIGMLVSGATFLAFLAWHFWPSDRSHNRLLSETPITSAKERPLGSPISPKIAAAQRSFREFLESKDTLGLLYPYFETDFANDTVSAMNNIQMHVTDSDKQKTDLIIPYQLFFDFERNIIFASAYIPATKKEEIAFICGESIAKEHRKIFDRFNKAIHIASPRPGEMATVSNDKLKFNGRIFLYYENFISDDHIAMIRLEFTKAGSDVVFRGPNYLTYIQAKRAAAK